jgi:hypothetical protein
MPERVSGPQGLVRTGASSPGGLVAPHPEVDGYTPRAAQSHSKKGRLVATYCPILVDYTTDEVVLADLLNDYRLVVHRRPLRSVHD